MAEQKARFVELISPDNKKSLLAIEEIITIEQNPEGVNTLITLRNQDKKLDRRSYIQFKEHIDKNKDVIG